ncbi:MAG: glycosyltransferase [bacterium]|nr:glycosyltransferase [bacterium]
MNDLICISHLRWDFVWQRPQHLLSRLALTHRVLFVEEPIASSQAETPHLDVSTRTLANGASVTVIRLIQPVIEERWIGHGDPLTQAAYSALLKAYTDAQGIRDPLLWLYTPMALDFTSALDYRLLVVDVMDQLSAFKGAPRDLKHNEAMLLPVADVVFTGGISLYRDKLPFNNHTYAFPSGVESAHFARAANRENFPAPAPLDALQGPVIGYFGVIDERMDMHLLRTMAAQRPDWNIVLLGPVVKIDPAELPQAPNLHYPGMRTYEQLPAYLAHFDVALIPFALNESTRYLSPTKTLEYMAAHKPVVSTAIYDVSELYGDVVRIGRSHAEFIGHVEMALRESPVSRRARELELLDEHSWDRIAARMMDILEALSAQQPAMQSAPPAARLIPAAGARAAAQTTAAPTPQTQKKGVRS